MENAKKDEAPALSQPHVTICDDVCGQPVSSHLIMMLCIRLKFSYCICQRLSSVEFGFKYGVSPPHPPAEIPLVGERFWSVLGGTTISIC